MNLTVDKMVNQCGDCVLCCVIPAIEEAQYAAGGMLTAAKPFGKVCDHCTGRGCASYAVRPPVCRNYECLWKFGLVTVPPLTSGVMWSLEFNGETQKPVVVCLCEDSHKTLASPDHLSEIEKFLASSINGVEVDFVVVRCGAFVSKVSAAAEGVRVDTASIVNGRPQAAITTTYRP